MNYSWFTEKHTENTGLTFSVSDILVHERTPYQELQIVETPEYGKVLLLDGLVMLTERDEFVYHEMISHVPLFGHYRPENVLIIGGGDGGTLREVLKHQSIKHVDLVEIDYGVVKYCRQYFPQVNNGAFDSSRVTLFFEDGIEFVHSRTPKTYDVVIVDSSDPIGPGQGLFAGTFYQDLFRILKDDGILVAQTETPIGRPEMVKNIYRRLHQSFLFVHMYLAYIPTYPSGMWSFAYCPKEGRCTCYDPSRYVRYTGSGISCKYYNASVHGAAFCLPNFIHDLVLQG